MNIIPAMRYVQLMRDDSEIAVPWAEMVERLKRAKVKPLGEDVFTHLLANPDQIPKDWLRFVKKQAAYFSFAGTPEGSWVTTGSFPCLYWDQHGQLLTGRIGGVRDYISHLDCFVVEQ